MLLYKSEGYSQRNFGLILCVIMMILFIKRFGYDMMICKLKQIGELMLFFSLKFLNLIVFILYSLSINDFFLFFIEFLFIVMLFIK